MSRSYLRDLPTLNIDLDAWWCEEFKKLDQKFDTSKDSPLHHDNRCKKCKPKPCRSGHIDCTVDCGWCKGKGVEQR